MTITLHNIGPAKGSKKRKKRVGRGNASGHGTYSARGQKGQRSRSGGRAGLQRIGLKPLLQKIPKVRGFKSQRPRLAVINLRDLEKIFSDGELVTPKKMKAKDLIKSYQNGVKVLSQGSLTKKLKIQANQFSQGAIEKIKKAGAEMILIEDKRKKETESAK